MIKCGRSKTNPLKMQRKTATNILWYGKCLCLRQWKHLYSWERITQTIGIPSKIHKITMKQMFDISEKLITKQSDEIYWMSTINWEHSLWKYLSLVGDEQVINLLHKKVYVFSDYVLCLGKMNENPQSNYAWVWQIDVVQKFIRIQNFGQNWWWADGIRVEYFPRFQPQSPRVTVKIECNTRKIHWTGHLHVDVQRHLTKDNKKDCESCAQLVSLYAKRFGAGQWSFLGPGSEKKWYSISEDSPQGEWDRIAEQMMLTFAESKHPIFRSTSPFVQRSAQEQRWWKIIDTLSRRPGNDWNCFSHNYFCKSAQSLRSNRRNVWWMRILPWQTRETCCGRTIQPIVRSKCDEDKHTFDWWSCTTRRSIATI